MDSVRTSIWVHGPLTSSKLVPKSYGRHIAFRHLDGHSYQCTVPDVDFEGPAHDVSIVTKAEHQAFSISYEKVERTYFYPYAKPRAALIPVRAEEPAVAAH